MGETGVKRSCKIQSNSDVNSRDWSEMEMTALDELREVSWNWFAFVKVLEKTFETHDYAPELFDQFLTDFAVRLPNLGLHEEELRLTEQSRLAYLENLHQKELDLERLSDSPTDSSEDEHVAAEVKSTSERDSITNKLHKITDKYRKKTKCEIAQQRPLQKMVSRSTKTIIETYPDIGEVIENIVQESDLGADSWQRTGVYMFTGDPKKTKRITFRKIQEKLKERYGRHFGYGTVVQLCVCRHKRRISSKRYKSVANVKYQRARKCFNVKYNPDYKWSRSLYKLLNQLQIDGKHTLLLNRDDQAGFRLDSTYTHKSIPTLSIKPTATTRTDFTNKYPAQLQVTSYNFSKTVNSDEVCFGVVKASVLHEKCPSQHAADLESLQNMDKTKSVFFTDKNDPKEVEFIRVDGGTDEGPAHHEVQFLWTERHGSRPTKVTLVTTRCSGDSYLNRVELQNGCLRQGRSNTFIPSTLCGSPFNEEAGLNEEVYKANMSAAVDQYIARVDGTLCMKTKIHLSRGAENHNFLTRRSQLLTFLKGSKKDKEELE